MPEFTTPGVFVEENGFRRRSIEAVSTSTTAFLGPTRDGPTDVQPELLTSIVEFERVYGDGGALEFDGGTVPNYMWHSARAFFANGGQRLYVARMVEAASAARGPMAAGEVVARYPGAAGNGRLAFVAHAGACIGTDRAGWSEEQRLQDGEIVQVLVAGATRPQWRRARVTAAEVAFVAFPRVRRRSRARTLPGDLILDARVLRIARARSVTITWTPAGATAPSGSWELPADVRAITEFFAIQTSGDRRGSLPVIVTQIANEALYDGVLQLSGGTDGTQPPGAAYAGRVDLAMGKKTGLRALEDIDEISIVAAPGLAGLDSAGMLAGIGMLQEHVERLRYRVAVLDPPRNLGVDEVRRFRSHFDSSRMALYYPWVRVRGPAAEDPGARVELDLPPCGFVAGIYARSDIEGGVHKAPANAKVHLAIDFARRIDRAQQEVLNPEGINCLRFFAARGLLVFGARTTSSDPEWKYVNMRRYFAYLEHSIDRGTRWAVFEPNGPPLWSSIVRAIGDFLWTEYRAGALSGAAPEQAFFVRCDRSTMTQNDLDTGRLVCLVGVAPVRPAEFVIFRIGQWTADART